MLKQIGFKKIAQLLNKALATDGFVLQQFGSLQGKTLRLQLTRTPFDFLIKFQINGIELHPFSQNDIANVSLTGSPFALLQFAKTQAQTQMLMDKKIQIHGDLELLMQIKKIQDQLNMDWEGLLAEYLGDFAATRLFSFANILRKKARTHYQLIQNDTLDYLHYEIQLLPTQQEVENFYEEIRILRRDIDRLTVRLNKQQRSL